MTPRRPSLETLRKIWHYSRHRTLEGEVYSVRNPGVLFRRAGTLELTDGTKLPFDATTKESVVRLAMFALDRGVRFGQEKGQWRLDAHADVVETPQGIRLLVESLDPTIFTETFLHDVHFVDFDLNGKAVVEGGGFVGDTALYFAHRGATVYTFEPDPRSFALAQRNFALNPTISGRITPRNWAIGADGEVNFPLARGGSGGSSLASPAPKHVTVRSVSVRTILDELHVSNPYLLHLDIKGQEFTVIEDPALARFERVRIEYSPFLWKGERDPRRTLDYLLDRLDRLGFHEIRTFKHNAGVYDLRNHGTIDARRTSD